MQPENTPARRQPSPIVLTLLLAVALFAAGCGGEGGSGELAEPAAARQEASEGQRQRVENGLLGLVSVAGDPTWALAERMEHHGVPGLSVAVIDNFELAWEQGYGVADPASGARVSEETRFPAGAVSRMVSALVTLELVEQGAFSLETPIDELLASWRLPRTPEAGDEPVTVGRILSHSSGINVLLLAGYLPGTEIPSLDQILAGGLPANNPPIEVIAPPGSALLQSDGAFAVLQKALEDRTGKPFEVLAEETVLGPLGMTRSGYEVPGQGAAGTYASGRPVEGGHLVHPVAAANGLWTTPGDLARLVLEIQHANRDDSGRLITLGTADRMLSRSEVQASGLGVFLSQMGNGMIFQENAGSEGFFPWLVSYRKRGAAAVVMANSEAGEALVAEVLRSIARAYGWWSYLPAPLEEVAIEEGARDAYTGRYAVDGIRVIRVEKAERPGRLTAREAAAPHPSELVPLAEHQFGNLSSGLLVSFPMGEDGRAAAYTVHSGGQATSSFPRMRDDRPTATELLAAGRIEEATAELRSFGEIPHQSLNQLGVELLGQGKSAEAVAVFELATELHPAVTYLYDSLAEGHLAAGDRAAASAAYRALLEKLPADSFAPPAFQRFLEARARYRLSALTTP